MPDILILTVSTGGGHNSVANALKESFTKKGINACIIDALKFVNPTLDRIISSGYEKSAKYIPSTYGSIYNFSGANKKNKNNLDDIMQKIIGKKILHLIQTKTPDAVISTHPFPAIVLDKYKEKGIINIPIISVITDYTAHPSYIQKNIDAFIVADEDISYILNKFGIDKGKIYNYGIPVCEKFLNTNKIDEIKEQLNLSDKFTVLLIGGSFGAGNIKETLLDMLKSNYDFQILVVTGNDFALKQKIEKTLSDIDNNKNIRVLGYTKNMPELLSVCDCIVSKPGGLTTTEAIIKATPIIIPFYIPGQEAENIDYLLNNGLALKTSKNYPISTLIEILIDNPKRILEIKNRMLERRKLNSSDKIVELVLELINRS